MTIKNSVDRLQYLNSTHQIAQSIYTYSLCWVYLFTNENKQVLRDILFLEIPKLREQRNSIKNEGINTLLIDSSLIYIDSLAGLSIKNIKSLLTFEDYYDSTDNYSINFKTAEVNLNNRIVPLYRKFIDQVNKSIQAEMTLISNTIATGFDDQSKLNLLGIEENYRILTEKMENRELYGRLFPEAINLVYRESDSTARKIIKSSIQVSPKVSFEEEIDAQIKNEQFLDSFQKFQTEISHLNLSLVKQSDYDDMLTMLLCEDMIESAIFPEFLTMELVIEGSIDNHFDKLRISISQDADKKRDDIKKILKYSYSTLQLITSESNRLNPKFDLEDLLDQIVLVYSKRFTHNEIKEILKFQNSKVGRKLQKNSVDILLEIAEITRNYLKEITSEN